jgi:hypothetical protein
MSLHPSVHLELARQRHQDLLAAAERRRIAKAPAGNGVAARAARRQTKRLEAGCVAAAEPSGGGDGVAMQVSHLLTAAEKPATVDER